MSAPPQHPSAAQFAPAMQRRDLYPQYAQELSERVAPC